MTAEAAIAIPEEVAGQYAPEAVAERTREAGRLVAEAYAGLPESAPYRRRFAAVKKTRQPMESIWREVRDFIVPACGRYLDGDDDPNAEDYTVSYSQILDSAPTKMAITAADGLHGGLTNQSEQWFTLYVGNYKTFRRSFTERAREWITNAQECIRDTLASSNFYSAIYTLYLELICFGTALMLILADPQSRVRYYTQTVGSYWLSQDSRRRVDAVFVKYVVRAEDIVKDYGAERCPQRVLDCLADGRADFKFVVIQCIQPWNYFGRGTPHPEFVYEDVRWVDGGGDDEEILFRHGYRTCPFVAVRWSDSGDSVYGRYCPGIDALPDVKQLQTTVRDCNMAVKWKSDPAFVTSSNEIESVIPGQIYKVDGNVRDNLLQPLVVADFDIPANNQAAQQLRDKISAIMYNREILLVQSRERQITATEVNQLIQEKNSVLGPITARIGDNVHTPVLDRTREIETMEWHVLPDMPDEILGMEVKPYFTGQLAKAQRQGSVVQQIRQTVEIAGAVASLDPEALMSFDFSAMLRAADEIDLFLPGTIRSQDKVEELQEQAREAAQQQQQMAGMQQALGMAQAAGDTSMGPDTLLGRMAGGEDMA